MTGLSKPIRRRAHSNHPDARKTRQLVIEIAPEPLPMVRLRPARHRHGYEITLDALYDILAVRHAEILRKQKIAERKARKKCR